MGLLGVAAPARAQAPDACATAAEEAQSLRDARKLRDARSKLLVCASEGCPAVVRRFCAQWLAEVTESLPSVVVQARDARGRDVIAVRVTIDGNPFLGRLDGSAVPVDPGAHVFRGETPSGEVAEERVLVGEGDRMHRLTIAFRRALTSEGAIDEPSPPATPPAAASRDALRDPHRRDAGASGGRPVPTLAVVLGVASVAALGAFATLDAIAWSDYRNLAGACGATHSCSGGAIADVRTKFVAAGACLAAGVVSLGAAGFVWLASAPAASGAAVGVGRSF
jgi:hypothetical protein